MCWCEQCAELRKGWRGTAMLQVALLVLVVSWLMCFSLSSCNLLSWIIPRENSSPINFALFIIILLVKGNRVTCARFSTVSLDCGSTLSYRSCTCSKDLLGSIKPVRFYSLRSQPFCLSFLGIFNPVTLHSTPNFAASPFSCSRIFLVVVLPLPLPVIVAVSKLKDTVIISLVFFCLCLLHLAVVRSFVSSVSSFIFVPKFWDVDYWLRTVKLLKSIFLRAFKCIRIPLSCILFPGLPEKSPAKIKWLRSHFLKH